MNNPSKVSAAAAAFLCGILLQGTTALADGTVHRGSTTSKTQFFGYDMGSGNTTSFKSTSRQMEYAVTSSAGGDAYGYFTVDPKTKTAFKYTGNFASGGPKEFSNINGKGKKSVVFDQFNQAWTMDSGDGGDPNDIFLFKAGMLLGDLKLTEFKESGSSFEAPQSLSGSHTLTQCSDSFTPIGPTSYLPGNFFQREDSKSSFRMDKKLTDQAQSAGGTVADGISVVESMLTSKGFSITNMGPLPF